MLSSSAWAPVGTSLHFIHFKWPLLHNALVATLRPPSTDASTGPGPRLLLLLLLLPPHACCACRASPRACRMTAGTSHAAQRTAWCRWVQVAGPVWADAPAYCQARSVAFAFPRKHALACRIRQCNQACRMHSCTGGTQTNEGSSLSKGNSHRSNTCLSCVQWYRDWVTSHINESTHALHKPFILGRHLVLHIVFFALGVQLQLWGVLLAARQGACSTQCMHAK